MTKFQLMKVFPSVGNQPTVAVTHHEMFNRIPLKNDQKLKIKRW